MKDKIFLKLLQILFQYKFIFLILFLFSCHQYTTEEIHKQTQAYELIIPKDHKELLILFPGYNGTSETIKTESNLVQNALKKHIGVLIFKINQNLFLKDAEKKKLAEQLSCIVLENSIRADKLYLGGFSAGGNLALLLGKYLEAYQNGEYHPKGIFVVDAPVDLTLLYANAEKSIQQNNEKLFNESEFIVDYLNREIGDPEIELAAYQKYSPYIYSSETIQNIALKNTEFVFFTEPALEFNREVYQKNYKETNGFQLKNLFEQLKKEVIPARFIETKNKGFRKSGARNPHSWSIIDQNKLLNWFKKVGS